MSPAPLVARGLGKRFRREWCLRDCTLEIPEGAVVGLAGPNAAGKSTLLALATGMLAPTEGTISVLGRDPLRDPSVLTEVGFVAQGAPLYRTFDVGETIEYARRTNPRWDDALACELLDGLARRTSVGSLSAGDRARLALALVLGKRPRLLLLDEPVAALDPLARRHFLSTLTTAMAESEDELTVVLSSHLIADLERVCDHLILLAEARVQLCGDIEDLLAEHVVLVGPRKDITAIERAHTVVHATQTPRQSTLVIKRGGPLVDPAYQAEDISLEDLVLAYMGAAAPAAYAHLSTVGEEQ